ncbi:hypothetical protein [Brevundimonas sp. DWR2-3-1b1]|uniref:hypothetical protein n=1 Tax=unclassified Brevundimonas TaxID=2622653 RepID=UPI003CED7944
MWWIIGIFGAVILFGIMLAKADKASEQHATERDEKATALRTAFEQDRTAFLTEHFREPRFLCERGEEQAIIAAVDGGIRITSWTKPSELFWDFLDEPVERRVFTLASDRVYSFTEIHEATVSQDDVIEKYLRVVSTPVAVAKRKSGVGRAMLGGLVFGPMGAVVGAASAMPTSHTIKTVVTKQEDTRMVAGAPTLTLTVRSNPYSFERLIFSTIDDARSWGLWITDQL